MVRPGDALLGRSPKQLGMEIEAALGGGLVHADLQRMCLGEGIVAHAVATLDRA